MIGRVTKSYVRNCSVHHTFNRAVAVHGVFNLEVSSNVAYDNMGHAFFIEVGSRLTRAVQMAVASQTSSQITTVLLSLGGSVLCRTISQHRYMSNVMILRSLLFLGRNDYQAATRY
jgi:hypothetical protein